MLHRKKRTSLFIIAGLVLLGLTSGICRSWAFENDYETCIAIAYTGENYQGVFWEIHRMGEYDLWWKIHREDPHPRELFDLPNDSICSLRVRPGYRVTLYEHAELLGKSLTVEKDTPSLGDAWNRQASSLGIFEVETQELQSWLETIRSEAENAIPISSEIGTEETANVLKDYWNEFILFRNSGEPEWYGSTTDDERIAMGGILLGLFDDLGYRVSPWTSASFAQEMNNFYDWRKDLSIWYTACLVLNVDPLPYEEIFETIGQ